MTSFDQWIALKSVLTTGFTIGNVNTNSIITVEPGHHRSLNEMPSTDYWLQLIDESGPVLSNWNGNYADEKYTIIVELKNRVDSIRPPYDTLIAAYKLLFAEYRRLITAYFNAGSWDALWWMEPRTIRDDQPVTIKFTALRPGADQS